MNAPAFFWAKIWLRLGAVLLLVGIAPLLVQQYVLPDISPIVPVLLSVMVAPLGALCLVVGVILFLVAWARRPRGSS
jgi:polyferredoxin